MLEEIAILFGGRAAEEVFLNAMSTGASNDFERATKIARDMVTRFGMSDSLGAMVYVDTEQDGMFGKMSAKSVSEATQQKVDAEIRHIIDDQYALAKRLLEENRDKVEAMTAALMEWETIDADRQRHHGRQAAAPAARCYGYQRWRWQHAPGGSPVAPSNAPATA